MQNNSKLLCFVKIEIYTKIAFIYNSYYPTFGKHGIPNSRKDSTYFVMDDLHFHSMLAVTFQSNGRVEKHSFSQRSFQNLSLAWNHFLTVLQPELYHKGKIKSAKKSGH